MPGPALLDVCQRLDILLDLRSDVHQSAIS
jgi:hypothetical protein